MVVSICIWTELVWKKQQPFMKDRHDTAQEELGRRKERKEAQTEKDTDSIMSVVSFST